MHVYHLFFFSASLQSKPQKIWSNNLIMPFFPKSTQDGRDSPKSSSIQKQNSLYLDMPWSLLPRISLHNFIDLLANKLILPLVIHLRLMIASLVNFSVCDF